jgi:hypothetical protein
MICHPGIMATPQDRSEIAVARAAMVAARKIPAFDEENVMRAAILCVSSTLVLASCVVVNENKPEATTSQQVAEVPNVRGALSGQRQLLVSFYALGSDCTSLGYPTLKVAKAPQHGEVSVEQGTALADFSKGDVRNVCNGKSVPATVIYYTSVTGFIGEDSVAFERIGVRGAYGYHAYTIHVR